MLMSDKEALKIYQVMDDMFLTFKLFDKPPQEHEKNTKKIVAVCNAPRFIRKSNNYIPCKATVFSKWINASEPFREMEMLRCHLCKTLYSATTQYYPDTNQIDLSSLAVDITKTTKDFFDLGYEYATQ